MKQDGVGTCVHGGTCVDLHRFCHSRCCWLRCFAIIIILAGVFAAGYCAGSEGHERRGEGYRGHHMMTRYQDDMYGNESADSDSDGYGAAGDLPQPQMMYNMMRSQGSVRIVTVTTTPMMK